MKTVFFIRHAKSSWEEASLEDLQRPLNKRGLRDAPFMAKMLHGQGVRADHILSSPAKRALTTATYFAEVQGMTAKAIDVRPGIYHAYPDDLIELVHSLSDQWSTVFIFGHNPTLTSLINRFTEDYIANVATCGIVRVEAKIDSWTQFSEQTARLKAYYYPKQFFDS